MLWAPAATRILCASRKTSACVAPTGGSNIAGQLQQLTEWFAKIDRIPETSIDLAGISNTALAQARHGLRIGRARYGKCQVVQIAGAGRIGSAIGLPGSLVKIVIRRPSPGSK